MYTIEKPQAQAELPVCDSSSELGYAFEVLIPSEIVHQILQEVDSMPECSGINQYILDAIKMRLSLSPLMPEVEAALNDEPPPNYVPLEAFTPPEWQTYDATPDWQGSWQAQQSRFHSDGGAVDAA